MVAGFSMGVGEDEHQRSSEVVPCSRIRSRVPKLLQCTSLCRWCNVNIISVPRCAREATVQQGSRIDRVPVLIVFYDDERKRLGERMWDGVVSKTPGG